jgi:hypothetical protein
VAAHRAAVVTTVVGRSRLGECRGMVGALGR